MRPYSARCVDESAASAAPATAADSAPLPVPHASSSRTLALTCEIILLSELGGIAVDSSSERIDRPLAHERNARRCSDSERSL